MRVLPAAEGTPPKASGGEGGNAPPVAGAGSSLQSLPVLAESILCALPTKVPGLNPGCF